MKIKGYKITIKDFIKLFRLIVAIPFLIVTCFMAMFFEIISGETLYNQGDDED